MTSIKCPNNECKWEGFIKDYFYHQEECLEKTIECPYKKFGCNWQGTSVFYMEHHKSSCIFSQFNIYFQKIEKKMEELSEANLKNTELISQQNEYIQNLQKNIEIQNKVIETFKLILQGQNNIPLNFPKALKPPNLQGILRNLSITSLLEKGFKTGFIEPYSYPNSLEDLIEKFKNTRYLIIGGREKGGDNLILAAMGETREILKETTKERECHYHNGVYWYCMKGKAIGFSFSPNVYLYNADWIEGEEQRSFDDTRLSWHLTGNGGWRIGNIISLSESDTYEKVVLYW